MKLYQATNYKNTKGNSTTNDVIVLNDKERNALALRLVYLSDKVKNENIDLNFHDYDILNFLLNTLHFQHGGEMLDIMKPQLVKIDRLILKVYGQKFLKWFDELEYEGDITSKREMFDHMESKRKTFKKYEKEKETTLRSARLKKQLVKEVLE